MANAINGMPRGPESRAWKGGRRRSKGYIVAYAPNHPRASVNGTVPEHILIAEAAIGRSITSEIKVHHVNGKRDDNRNQNLVVCQDEAYHQLLHRRERVHKAGGNPNTDKICCGCQRPKSKTEFDRSRNATDGRDGRCKSCRAQRRLDALAIAA